MESTPVTPIVSVREGSLAAAFADLTDPRQPGRVVYPLPAMLTLVVAALLAGQTSVLAIAQWAARQADPQREALGFPPGRTPCQSTLHRLLRRLEGAPLAALQRATTATPEPERPAPPDPSASLALPGVAIDGKGQRGRLRRSGAAYATHAVCALEHTSGAVLAHAPLGSRPQLPPTELDAVPDLLARIAWRGRVLTADSLYCQRTICQTVCAAGGDYVLPVTGNQPRLQAFVQAHFTSDPAARLGQWAETQTAWTEETGHGRTEDRRELTIMPIAANPLAWPDLAQVYRLVRTWRVRGVAHTSVRYGITSLTPQQASAAQVLALRRGHWLIENALHRQKDVLFREDASQVHCGAAPAVLSLLRDAAITLLHRTGSRQLAARTRAFSQFPHQALALVCHPVPLRA